MSFAQPFANYEILARVGSGAMGTVFKARQKHMDRVVALKVLKPALARDARYVDRLRREARIVGQLSHPNIVTGYDLGEEGGYHFFVMEFVEGRSLRQLLAEWGSFPEHQVLDVAIQVTEALDHAWQRGVIHRDVKPGNILITDDGRLKLTDMGLAKGATDLTVTRHGATVGTPQYISPEQARDPSAVDIRSDLYSLGATLFHMATGQPPFRAETIGELISKVLDERPPSVAELDPELSQGLALVIQKLLAKDPDLRYQSPRDLLDDLERVRRAEQPRVDESALAREGRERRAHRSLPAVAAGVLVIASFAFWFFLLRGGDEGPPAAPDIDAFRRSVIEVSAAVAEAGYPARFARLHELRARTEDPDRLSVIAEEERRLAREVEARVDALAASFTGERREETEQWLSDPRHWSDADGFVQAVVGPAIEELTGYEPSALPDARLRAAVASRLDSLRVELAPLCARRDAAHARSFERYLRDDVAKPVRALTAAQDFRAAAGLLADRIEGFHGSDDRPAFDDLAPELRERLTFRGEAVARELGAEIRAAEASAAALLRRDAESRLAAIARLRDELRGGGGAPGPMREAIERAERELGHHHPPPEAFLDAASDPWPTVNAGLRALRGELAELEDRFDRSVLDSLLALGYRVFADAGPDDAARVVSVSQPLSPAIERSRAAHVAAFEDAARFRSALLDALLGAARETRVDGFAVRRVDDEAVVLTAGGAPVPPLRLDLETLLAAAPEPFRSRAQEDPRLRQGRAFWRLAHGDPAGAQALLGDAALAFHVEQVWPRLEALRDGRDVDAEAAELLSRAQDARARGDHASTDALLARFSAAFADTEFGRESEPVRAALAEWVRAEVRRKNLVADLVRRLPGGVSVEIGDDGGVLLSARAADFATEATDWIPRDGGLLLQVGPLGADGARRHRLTIPAPLAVDGDLALDVELSFPEAGPEPRVIVVELHGIAIALCGLPSGSIAATAIDAASAFDPDALGRALAQPISGSQPRPLVVPGAWTPVAIRLERVGERDTVVRAWLADRPEVALVEQRRVSAPDAEAVVRFGGFQSFGVRAVRITGRADV